MAQSGNLVWRDALKGPPSKKEPQPVPLLSPSPSQPSSACPFPSLSFSCPVSGLRSEK